MYLEVNAERVFVSTGTAGHKPDAPGIVFIHGAGMDHSIWVMPSRYFARHGFNSAAVDLPGHGRSQGAPLDTIDAMADWLAVVVDVLGFAPSIIVGHSMGSLVAYRFAVDHPDRCRAIALLGTSVPMPVTDVLLNAAADNDHAAIEMINTWSHSSQGKVGANCNPGVWMMGTGERLLERASPGVLHADLRACHGFAEVSHEVMCPSLVIAAGADLMTPARAGLEVAKALPNAEIVSLDGCGHFMLSERPNDVLDALAMFAKGL
ncbi:MAG: alpha/beta hydrolase [Gammaproteobacteria bacterium]|uniref:AB hydrolase-1 domain-containing protein n=1 Tax=marine metagenome TaxID=408172 RepID=A0A381P7M3_9ZZZZ|nr:alpha/beta hydrolase [Gammaproteobacteria bacterium]MBN84472.1 alpha/beta hydrolase [Gammaproteobacteria bacterium]MCS5571073.1 alpha/beta hydrolase [Pseudomonadales bacterium]MED5556454.1 alpha/beta hydrolase [Pseudomonadota bacterium]MEE3133658.1 alpha/beta hydrolase [Pseudomonadota bacterium]|tara:strand:- start:7434 stop:8222 length:789 start_codon:yes stop_codon:yes gene_type:complete